jgi:glutamyl-Q tRNA(Asp) synthetase
MSATMHDVPSRARYRGRFAPTPSGPLHFGSMVAAVGSYLDAKHHGGEWLVRIDDLDLPRVVPGAADGILRCLERFRMQWDGAVAYQSEHSDAYRSAVEQLERGGRVFACGCSRKDIEEAAMAGLEGALYPGTCRNGLPPGRSPRSLRVRTDNVAVEFSDRLQGPVRQQLAAEVGDFILWRTDGIYSYHLACAVDDAEARITHVVRGADLIASTPRQIYLQRLLDLRTPEYLHLPIAVNDTGEKLSKQTQAPPVGASPPAQVLLRVLGFLGHAPPAGMAGSDLADLWTWARENWRRDRLPAKKVQPLPA